MRPVLTLARFLSLFLIRRVLRRGALQLAAVRWGLAAVALLAFTAFCAFGVVTLPQLITDPALLVPLLRVAGAAVPMWVLAIFTVVRILFVKSSDLVELTFGFPLTNRARTLGFMLFEAMLVGMGVTVILGALIAGTMSIGGIRMLDDVVVCLVLPTCVAYLLASLYYLVVERILLQFRLARLRAFLVPVILAGTLVLVSVAVSSQSERVLFAAAGREEYFTVQLIFADLAAAHGFPVSMGVWALVVAVLIAIVCSAAPRQFAPTRRFARVPRILGSSEFGAYFVAHIRAIETLTVNGIVFAGSYALFVADVRVPPFLLIAVTIQSMYAYVSTEPLRACAPRRHRPAKSYLLVLGPQLLALAACAVPICVLSALTGIGWGENLMVVGFSASNVVVLTLAGIAFPPEKGNPFSVVVGVVVAALVTGTLLLGMSMLGLPTWASTGMLSVVTICAAALSIVGMKKIERIERHEVVA